MFSEAAVRNLLHDERLASPVASLYLNTDRMRPEGEKYLAGFREVMHMTVAPLRARKDPQSVIARARLKDALPALEEALEREVGGQPVVRGAAIFVSLAAPADHDLKTPPFTLFTLPRPLRTQGRVQQRPYVRPLLFLLDQYERVGVIAADRTHARILTLFLGEIESARHRTSDTPTHHQRGGWKQMLLQRDAEGHLRAHVRATVRDAVKQFAAAPLKRVVLGGSEELRALLERELPPRYQQRMAGTFRCEPHASDAEIVTKALACAQRAEQVEEARRVDELLEALAHRSPAIWGSGGSRAVRGVDDTLLALTERRVRRLLLVRGKHLPGSACDNCGTLTSTAGGCPTCASPLRPVPDVLEEAVERALEEGAEIEFVTDSPALEAMGGVGALLRF